MGHITLNRTHRLPAASFSPYNQRLFPLCEKCAEWVGVAFKTQVEGQVGASP